MQSMYTSSPTRISDSQQRFWLMSFLYIVSIPALHLVESWQKQEQKLGKEMSSELT